MLSLHWKTKEPIEPNINHMYTQYMGAVDCNEQVMNTQLFLAGHACGGGKFFSGF